MNNTNEYLQRDLQAKSALKQAHGVSIKKGRKGPF
jgi:hypothetical protein